MSESDPKVVRSSREVIEGKLLTALEDDNVVAVILSLQDLQDLIDATKLWHMRDSKTVRFGNLRRGLEKLLAEVTKKEGGDDER